MVTREPITLARSQNAQIGQASVTRPPLDLGDVGQLHLIVWTQNRGGAVSKGKIRVIYTKGKAGKTVDAHPIYPAGSRWHSCT